jgi:hypothetical protein
VVELADGGRIAAAEQGFSVETKLDRSLVTDVDRAVERQWERLERWFPDHGVIGEEYPPTRAASPFQWIMDPIDGTEEFVHGIPTFGTMLALHHRGVPLVGVIDHPALDIRVNAGVGLGTHRNGNPVRPEDTPGSRRAERSTARPERADQFQPHPPRRRGAPLRGGDHARTRTTDLSRRLRPRAVTGAAKTPWWTCTTRSGTWRPSQVLTVGAGGWYVVVGTSGTGRSHPERGLRRPAVVDRLVTLFRGDGRARSG